MHKTSLSTCTPCLPTTDVRCEGGIGVEVIPTPSGTYIMQLEKFD